MAIKSKEERVSHTRQRPVWPEGSPLESHGAIPIVGRVSTIVGRQWVHIIHMLFDTLLSFSLVCLFIYLFLLGTVPFIDGA